jgi:hypothetical protein
MGGEDLGVRRGQHSQPIVIASGNQTFRKADACAGGNSPAASRSSNQSGIRSLGEAIMRLLL